MSESICPECLSGKHVNCDGRALDEITDLIVQCQCGCQGASR